MGSESLPEMPRMKPFICKIRMFLRGATSQKQRQEEPAVLDAESASGHEAGKVKWAEEPGRAEGAGSDNSEGRGGERQGDRGTERPGALKLKKLKTP